MKYACDKINNCFFKPLILELIIDYSDSISYHNMTGAPNVLKHRKKRGNVLQGQNHLDTKTRIKKFKKNYSITSFNEHKLKTPKQNISKKN